MEERIEEQNNGIGTETIKKRKRGRKAKTDTINESEEKNTNEERTIETAKLTDEPISEPEPEPKPKRKTKKGTPDLEGIKALLGSTHALISVLLKDPEFNLSDLEKETLAKALFDIEKEFNIMPSGKTMAIVNLIGVSFMVYMPRIRKLQARVKEQKSNNATIFKKTETQNPKTDDSFTSALNEQLNRRG